jgi:hypothetical protein
MAVKGKSSTVKARKSIIQGSLFEDGYLIKTLGNIVRDPEYALSELVANAWDAGATQVDIAIPTQEGERIEVADNGIGLTLPEFKRRWMKLGYDRQKHQGKLVEFPKGVDGGHRPAYGRNGVGRHGMLCFGSTYTVVTKKGGTQADIVVSPSSGRHPFVIQTMDTKARTGHGTTVTCTVERNLPSADRIRQTLSARFISDPMFTVSVNRVSLALEALPGATDFVSLPVEGFAPVEVMLLDSLKTARTKQKQGFTFWKGKRLVGEPSWVLGHHAPVDGRSLFGRRMTIIVKCDAYAEEVESDWSGFRRGEKRNAMFKALSDYATKEFMAFSTDKVEDTKKQAFIDNLPSIRQLTRSGRTEVEMFVEAVLEREPTMRPDSLATAVQAVINLRQSKSGQRLLQRMANFQADDIESLDRLLDEWSLQDALSVLDEIDRRIAVVSAIDMLATRSDVDELHTLHPLVTEARWLFGPEYDTSEYASNRSLKNAVNQVFKGKAQAQDFSNWRKRPDLLLKADATFSSTALEAINQTTNLATIEKVLLIELKRGASEIGETELGQAMGYINQIKQSGYIQGQFFTNAYVVGARVDNAVSLDLKLGEHARIQGVCYSTLTQTASKRLFKLRERVEGRYDVDTEGKRSKVLDELLAQTELSFPKSQARAV